MQVTIKLLLAAALLAGFVFASQPSAVLADYDADDARRDQGLLNQLAAEGVINPNQAAMFDQRAVNRANGGWWHRSMTPMFTGVSNAPLIGNIAMGQTLSGGLFNRDQANREFKQIDKLLRDGVISPGQAAQWKAQIGSAINGGYNGGWNNHNWNDGILSNGGWNNHGCSHNGSNSGYYPTSIGSNLASTFLGTGQNYPNYYNNNNNNYYNNGSIWQRARSYFHN